MQSVKKFRLWAIYIFDTIGISIKETDNWYKKEHFKTNLPVKPSQINNYVENDSSNQ